MRRWHEGPCKPNQIFVFGSNRLGIHGAGAAKTAKRKFGYPSGKSEGLAVEEGMAYAIPTKWTPDKSMSLEEVTAAIQRFKTFALTYQHPYDFYVTRVGCGLAGFTDDQIGPLFMDAPENCILPTQWRKYALP